MHDLNEQTGIDIDHATSASTVLRDFCTVSFHSFSTLLILPHYPTSSYTYYICTILGTSIHRTSYRGANDEKISRLSLNCREYVW